MIRDTRSSQLPEMTIEDDKPEQIDLDNLDAQMQEKLTRILLSDKEADRTKLLRRVTDVLNETLRDLKSRGDLGEDPLGMKAFGRALSAEAHYTFYGKKAEETVGDLKTLVRAVPDLHIRKLVEIVGLEQVKPWWKLEWLYRQGRLIGDWDMTWRTDKDVSFEAQILPSPETEDYAEEGEAHHGKEDYEDQEERQGEER